MKHSRASLELLNLRGFQLERLHLSVRKRCCRGVQWAFWEHTQQCKRASQMCMHQRGAGQQRCKLAGKPAAPTGALANCCQPGKQASEAHHAFRAAEEEHCGQPRYTQPAPKRLVLIYGSQGRNDRGTMSSLAAASARSRHGEATARKSAAQHGTAQHSTAQQAQEEGQPTSQPANQPSQALLTIVDVEPPHRGVGLSKLDEVRQQRLAARTPGGIHLQAGRWYVGTAGASRCARGITREAAIVGSRASQPGYAAIVSSRAPQG